MFWRQLATGSICGGVESDWSASGDMKRPTIGRPTVRALDGRQDRLHPPFPQDIGTMCGLGKGAARRLGLTNILAPAKRRVKCPAPSAQQPGQS